MEMAKPKLFCLLGADNGSLMNLILAVILLKELLKQV